jgi:hypothetical protein
MDLFSEAGSRVVDIVGISAMFLLVMLGVFEKEKKHRWWKYVNLSTFCVCTILTIISRTGQGVKFFAAVMLISALVIEIAVSRKRRLEAVWSIRN